MGPTGSPTETPSGETVLLAGGGLGNAVLFSIGRGLRAAGSKVLYFAGYKQAIDRYKVADIEAAADAVVWTRSEERRGGKECVSTCRSRWSPYNSKKNHVERAHVSTSTHRSNQ